MTLTNEIPQSSSSLQPQGWFCDGKTAQRWPVEVKVKPDALLIRVMGELRVNIWPLQGLNFQLDEGQLPAVIRAYKDGQRVDVTDPKYITILRKTPAARLTGKNFWNNLDAKEAFTWSAAVYVLLIALYFVWPLIADAIAPAIPERYIQATGDREMKFLSSHAHKCTAEDGQKTLNKIVARLAPDQVANGLTINLFDGSEINAYAVPPNRIIVMDGLVRNLSSGDEIVAVIAHEIGHIKAKHAARLITRNLGASLIATLVGVDQTVMLLSKAHSRDMEREADKLGLEMMQTQHISPAIMVDLFHEFAKIEQKQNNTGIMSLKLLSYLASHPLTSAREKMAQQAASAYKDPRTPTLTDSEWKSLQTMCDVQKLSRAQTKADLGDAKAQATVAARYLEGKGTPVNQTEAYRMAGQSAEGGDSGGEFLVAFMSLEGKAAPRDEKKALQYMTRSAEHGSATAQMYLGVMYRQGIGTVVDNAQADLWVMKATQQKAMLSEVQITSNMAAIEYNAAQKRFAATSLQDAEGMRLALHAAKMGYAKAQIMIATFYLGGKPSGMDKDSVAGFEWAMKAAQQDFGPAESLVAALYRNGIGVTASETDAATWDAKAVLHQPVVAKETIERWAGIPLASSLPLPPPLLSPVPPLAAPLQSSSLPEKLAPANSVAVSSIPVSSLVVSSSAVNSELLAKPPPALVRSERPLSQSYPDSLSVMTWASEAAKNILTLDYQNYAERMMQAKSYFTESGWPAFDAALADSKLIDALKSHKMGAVLTIDGTAEMVGEGLENGIYAWNLRMPVTLSFTGEQVPQPIKSILNLKVVRAPASHNEGGIGIQQWVIGSPKL
jgi:TPR repeat protein